MFETYLPFNSNELISMNNIHIVSHAFYPIFNGSFNYDKMFLELSERVFVY